MKHIFLILVLHIANTVSSQYDYRKNIFPVKSQFNADQAKELLSYGNSTIKGIAFTREYTDANRINNMLGINVVGKKHIAAEGTKVVLFPLTDYFEEYLRLRAKHKKSKKYKPILSEEAFSYRIEVLVDKEGTFVFNKMKPGKYYLEALVNFNGTDIASKQVGRTDYYNGLGHYKGSSPLYQHYVQYYNGSKLETKIIEIKKDNTVLNIKL